MHIFQPFPKQIFEKSWNTRGDSESTVLYKAAMLLKLCINTDLNQTENLPKNSK